MDNDSIKDMVLNLTNELTAIKLLDPESAAHDYDDNDGGGRGDVDRHPTRNQIEKAFDAYLSESRPLPVEFFKEECRAMFDEELRSRRKLLHDKLKKSTRMSADKSTAKRMSRYSRVQQRPVSTQQPAKSPPTTTVDYRSGRYGSLDRILHKIDHLTRTVRDTIEDETYSAENLSSMGSFAVVHRKLLKGFNLQKMKLTAAHQSIVHVVDQLVHTHRSVAKICESIAQETRKRYSSEEIYSDDGSVIIVGEQEKHYVSQLNFKIDYFLKQKTKLIQILEKITTLLRYNIEYGNELDVKLMVYASKWFPLQYKNIVESILTTNTEMVNKTGHGHNIQLCKIFTRFPCIGDVPGVMKDQ